MTAKSRPFKQALLRTAVSDLLSLLFSEESEQHCFSSNPETKFQSPEDNYFKFRVLSVKCEGRIFRHTRPLKCITHSSFLGKLLEMLLYQNEGVNQEEEDIGSKKWDLI